MERNINKMMTLCGKEYYRLKRLHKDQTESRDQRMKNRVKRIIIIMDHFYIAHSPLSVSGDSE